MTWLHVPRSGSYPEQYTMRRNRAYSLTVDNYEYSNLDTFSVEISGSYPPFPFHYELDYSIVNGRVVYARNDPDTTTCDEWKSKVLPLYYEYYDGYGRWTGPREGEELFDEAFLAHLGIAPLATIQNLFCPDVNGNGINDNYLQYSILGRQGYKYETISSVSDCYQAVERDWRTSVLNFVSGLIATDGRTFNRRSPGKIADYSATDDYQKDNYFGTSDRLSLFNVPYPGVDNNGPAIYYIASSRLTKTYSIPTQPGGGVTGCNYSFIDLSDDPNFPRWGAYTSEAINVAGKGGARYGCDNYGMAGMAASQTNGKVYTYVGLFNCCCTPCTDQEYPITTDIFRDGLPKEDTPYAILPACTNASKNYMVNINGMGGVAEEINGLWELEVDNSMVSFHPPFGLPNYLSQFIDFTLIPYRRYSTPVSSSYDDSHAGQLVLEIGAPISYNRWVVQTGNLPLAHFVLSWQQSNGKKIAIFHGTNSVPTGIFSSSDAFHYSQLEYPNPHVTSACSSYQSATLSGLSPSKYVGMDLLQGNVSVTAI